MSLANDRFSVNTQGHTDIIDITKNVQNVVYRMALQSAQVLIYVAGSTASITTMEFEPGLLVDFPEAMEKVAPEGGNYHHDETWHDGNGYAHLRASMIGNSTTIPVVDGVLQLGTWQQIVLIDFDNKPRNRNITVQIIY